MKKTNLNLAKGFTLIELLVVIAIIGILAGMIMVNLSSARARARDAKRVADFRTIANALELYLYQGGGAFQYTSELPGWGAANSLTFTQKTNCTTALPYPGPGGGSGIDSLPQCIWNVLADELSRLSILSPLPTDPQNQVISGVGYRYYYDVRDNRKGVILKTKLENMTDKMKNDSCPNNLTYYDLIVGDFPGGVDASCDDIYSPVGEGCPTAPAVGTQYDRCASIPTF